MESQGGSAHEAETRLEQRRATFEKRVVPILPDLLGAAIRLTKNRADAEDLVADTVAKAWQRMESLRDAASLRAWMFRILTNVFLTARRTQDAARMESLSAQGGEAAFSIFERLHQPFVLWWHNPEQEFLNKLLREDLLRALDRLSDEFRLVVL
ncbi:MAG: sigma-70 family RNA polymerase sigma factor, partial [Gemmatimonadetes bacterium]|nr:sigma-70 family RNA polymerase sigma factor [Gemmatimonadota bacterium]